MSKANRVATAFFVAQTLALLISFILFRRLKQPEKFKTPVALAALLGATGGVVVGRAAGQLFNETRAKHYKTPGSA
ncbi:MAG TPA: hypothetical protein VH186_05415 [Chloroflexia bacterium]|nr:hypothetical protein [Chloroflexia bacterium]